MVADPSYALGFRVFQTRTFTRLVYQPLEMVLVGNFAIPTSRLSGERSASELYKHGAKNRNCTDALELMRFGSRFGFLAW